MSINDFDLIGLKPVKNTVDSVGLLLMFLALKARRDEGKPLSALERERVVDYVNSNLNVANDDESMLLMLAWEALGWKFCRGEP